MLLSMRAPVVESTHRGMAILGRREEGSGMRTFGLPPLTLDRIEAAKAKNPKVRKTRRRTSVAAYVEAEGQIRIYQPPVTPVKKSRKLPTTPRSRVRSALRALWLRSRERAACLKAAGNRCERCHVKASVAKGREVKVQVHHRGGIAGWETVIDMVFEELLIDPQFLEAICEACHHDEHGKGEK